jgi:D-aminopeptidase
MTGERPRARDIGVAIGLLPPGPLNAITDVPGVKVGHATIIRGRGPLVPGAGPVRTGVTAIVPHDGDVFQEKVAAAAFVLNGFGKSVGLPQLQEMGVLETPILLTSTLNVPRVADALIDWSIQRTPHTGIRTAAVNAVVGEVNDGFLNDLQGRHVRGEHVFQALAEATGGPVTEGSVGGGTGASCMGFKGGIGTASRMLPDLPEGRVLGVLVQTNYGGGWLTVNGAPVGRELGRPEAPARRSPTPAPGEPGGSVMVVVATDAPLDHRQLERVAKRVGLGLARTGFYSSNASGDIFIAFSTARCIAHAPRAGDRVGILSDGALDPVFLATVEATEEAAINSLLRATTVVGRDDNVREAIEIARLLPILRKYNALGWDAGLPAGPPA